MVMEDNKAGIKIKETGTLNWVEDNSSSTNESGFTALPGGARSSGDIPFMGEGSGGGWWSASPYMPYNIPVSYWVESYSDRFSTSDMLEKSVGLNVRCIKN
jgi:uncharacterized protein (TIGR02145 family)